MLLNLKLDVLGKLLHRDERKLGIVDSKMSIPSVKSKVINLEMKSDKFIDVVSQNLKVFTMWFLKRIQKWMSLMRCLD